ncbi:hypothetical protein ACFOOP_01310 [Marinicaulis aureus]|uniref:hypothetical protein n=1 Tax=Hyphococcus aureus TaxID=2666033 RepID=UPI0036216D70
MSAPFTAAGGSDLLQEDRKKQNANDAAYKKISAERREAVSDFTSVSSFHYLMRRSRMF